MEIIKERQLEDFMNKWANDLLRYYNNAPREVKSMMKNLYTVCYRFNLNNTQTIYILDEATRPFKNNILLNILGDD